jgi:iron complex transport system substrate-binding protein
LLNLFRSVSGRLLQMACMVLLGAAWARASAEPLPANVDVARRIISLAPHITELVFAAGAGDRLVAVVEYSDYPAEASRLPRIGDAFRVDYEAIALQRPDLVLAWRTGTPREITERLRSLGYRVVELDAGQLDDMTDQLLAIGKLAGTEASAKMTAAELQAAIVKLRADYLDRKQVSVFMQIAAEPLYSVTGAHIISDIIELCGGRNVFAGLSGVAPPVSVEAVVATDPDVIMATVDGGDARWMERWKQLSQMTAVQRGHLYTIDRNLISRSGPRIIDGAIQVCAALDQARDGIQDKPVKN